jgi:hypothetical protein
MWGWAKGLTTDKAPDILRTETCKICIREDSGIIFGLTGEWTTPDIALRFAMDKILSALEFYGGPMQQLQKVF